MQDFRVMVLGGLMVTACSTLLCLALETLQLVTSPFNCIAFQIGKQQITGIFVALFLFCRIALG